MTELETAEICLRLVYSMAIGPGRVIHETEQLVKRFVEQRENKQLGPNADIGVDDLIRSTQKLY